MLELQMYKKEKSGLSEQVEPYIQLNQEDIRKSEEITNALKKTLEHIYYLLDNLTKLYLHT